MDYANDFLKFEKENKMFDIYIYNVQIWPLIRKKIYDMFLNQMEDIGIAHPFKRLSKIEKLEYVIKVSKNIFKFNINKNNECDILLISHPRKLKEDEYYKCIYSYDIVEALSKKLNFMIIESPYNKKHLVPDIYENKIRITDFIYLKSNLISRIRRLSLTEKNKVLKIKNLLEKEMKINIELSKLEKMILYEICCYQNFYKYYKKIIRICKPRIILEVIHYNSSNYALNFAARENNIPTVELQHGIIYSEHIGYNYPEKVSYKGIPDYIFTFGSYWNKYINLPIKDKHVIPVGFEYINRQIKKFRVNSKNENFKEILILSQGPSGKRLSQMAVNLASRIDDNYRITYKLHPSEYNQWKILYPELDNKNIKVIDNNNKPLHYYLSKAYFQIGVNSTALYEGLAYGVKTFILKANYDHSMDTLSKLGYITYFYNVDELILLLKENNSYDKNQIDINSIWRKNAISNIKNEIERIIE